MDASAAEPAVASALSPTARQWLVQARAEQQLGALLQALRAVAVTPLVVKGFALAHQTYADSAERPLRDVDLRVLPSELQRARRAAERAGFQVIGESISYGNVVLERSGQHFDLETHIGAPYLTRMRVADLHARKVAVVTARGLRFDVPERVDHALLLAVNVFKDKFHGAAAYALADAQGAAATLDAEQFAQRAAGYYMQTLALVVAEWFARAGSASWRDVARCLAPLCTRRAYVDRMLTRLADQEITGLRLRVATRTVAESRVDRVKCAAASAAFAVEDAFRRRVDPAQWFGRRT